MQRPVGVTITTILMAANVGADIGHVFSSPAHHAAHMQSTGPVDHRLVLALHVFLYAVIVFQLAVVALYWMGRPIARQLVFGGAFFYLISLKGLHEQWLRSHFAAALTVGAAILALVLFWYLNTTRVKEWFYQDFYLPLPASPQTTGK